MSANVRMTFFYGLCRVVILFIARVLFFVRVRGRTYIPRSGGCIIASNHLSYLDPMLLAIAAPRMLCFMAKEELFRGWFGFLIRRLNAFPVRRGTSDLKAMRQAIDRLKNGHALIIFPEGTRSSDGEIQAGQPGIGMLAERAMVPIIPAYLGGVRNAWPAGARLPRFFTPLTVHFGPPVSIQQQVPQTGDRARYQAISDAIIEAMKKLKNNLS